MTERELEIAVEPFLQTVLTIYKFQVPIANRVIDCAGMDDKRRIIGIEFKLRSWKKVVEQAWKNRMSCDLLYVCMPNGQFVKKLCELAQEKGIGVILYDKENRESWIEQLPIKQERKWMPNIVKMLEYLEDER